MTSRDLFADLEARFRAVGRGDMEPDDAFLDFMWQHAGQRPRIPLRSQQKQRRARFLAHPPSKSRIRY